MNINITTKTIIPCSYYLTAPDMLGRVVPSSDYQTSFGCSSECSTYAKIYDAQGFENDFISTDLAGLAHYNQVISSVLNFSNCASITSDQFDIPSSYTPVGVSNVNYGGGATDCLCCGGCTLTVPEMRLLYFASTTYDCSIKYNTINSNTIPSSNSSMLKKHAHSLTPIGSTFVSDGYTL